MSRDFYAPIVLNCSLPSVPVQQKFLYLPISQSNIHKYSLSNIELKATPEIYTSYVLDQDIDIVNPHTYAIPENSERLPNAPEDDIFLSQPDAELIHAPDRCEETYNRDSGL